VRCAAPFLRPRPGPVKPQVAFDIRVEVKRYGIRLRLMAKRLRLHGACEIRNSKSRILFPGVASRYNEASNLRRSFGLSDE